jgi:hypothetical protein
MRAFSRPTATALVVVALTLGSLHAARAQVCGDADGDGTVTDTDGVQVLRAAVALSSVCTLAVCDVDGDGTITDTDGVRTLRKAALLPVEEACTLTGGTTAEVELAVDAALPLITFGLPLIPDVGVAAAGFTTDTADCPAGGTRTTRFLGSVITVSLDACRYSNPSLGTFEFEGSVGISLVDGSVPFDVTVTDVNSGRIVDVQGFIFGMPLIDGGLVVDGGPLTLTTPQGRFMLTFDALTVDGEGHVVSGAGRIEDTDDNFELDAVDFTANGDGTADLVAELDDGSTQSFLLNLVTGDLTPAS